MYGVIIMEVLPHILSSLRLQNSHSNFQEIQESTSILWACNLRLTILHPFLGFKHIFKLSNNNNNNNNIYLLK